MGRKIADASEGIRKMVKENPSIASSQDYTPAGAAGDEAAARAYFEKVIPHLRDDEYYKQYPGQSMTIQAFLAGAAHGRAEQKEALGRLREALGLAQQFNDGVRARVALKEPHYTASSILKDMIQKALGDK